MIRAGLLAILLLVTLNVLAGAGLVGWLSATGRLSQARVAEVVEMFELTLEQERELEAEAARLEAEAAEAARRQMRLASVADGPQTLSDRLEQTQAQEELSLHRVERLQRETADLRRQIERAQQRLVDERRQLEADREAFEQRLAEQEQLQMDADFQQTVQMYEQLRPAQTKQMFQRLMADGQTDEVVSYLAAMQLRTAGRVLQEFDAGEDLDQATELLQRLRERGVDLLERQAEAQP